MIMEKIYKINKNNILHSEMSNKRQRCAVVNLDKKTFPRISGKMGFIIEDY
jgi:hypothetical protein